MSKKDKQPGKAKQGNRWYEQNPKTHTAVDLMLKFPDEFLSIICQGVCMLAEQDFRASEIANQFKSIGSEKILALYKSKQRQREYDQNPHAHKAVNYLYMMTPENQVFLSDHIISMMDLVREYLETCQQHTLQAETKDVKQLTQTYVEHGADSARQILKEFQNRFISSVSRKTDERQTKPKAKPTQPEVQRAEKIEESDTDMKITGDN